MDRSGGCRCLWLYPDSHEDLLHDVLATPSLLVFTQDRTSGWLTARLGHRAIGVVYDPTAERAGNWVPTTMSDRYDAFCFSEDTLTTYIRTELLADLPSVEVSASSLPLPIRAEFRSCPCWATLPIPRSR